MINTPSEKVIVPSSSTNSLLIQRLVPMEISRSVNGYLKPLNVIPFISSVRGQERDILSPGLSLSEGMLPVDQIQTVLGVYDLCISTFLQSLKQQMDISDHMI